MVLAHTLRRLTVSALTGSIIALAGALPALAAELVNWRFDSSRNQLIFTTDQAVQPRAQLIENPTRLVVDLPGVNWRRVTAEQTYGGAVRSVRIGQVQPGTARIVVELAPGFRMDANGVRVQGLAPNQWSVQLPTPTRDGRSGPGGAIVTQPAPEGVQQERWVPRALAEILESQGRLPAATQVGNVSLGEDGIFLETSGGEPAARVSRSGDRRFIYVEFQNATLATGAARDNLVRRLGVQRLILQDLGGNPPRVRLTLLVDRDSPDWSAIPETGGTVAVKPTGQSVAGTGDRPSGGQRIPILPPTSRTPVPVNPQPMPPPTPTPGDVGPLPRPQGRYRIVIDPGHGGQDPGAVGIGGLREKDAVLDISRQVTALLEQQGVQAIMTRTDDYFVTLEGRTAMANRANANLFVSIHANAISLSRPDVNGVETYYLQSGQALAQTIHNSILQTFPYMRNRGVRQARFYVLRHSRMPAVLVETGFVTGQQDAALLSDPRWRSQMAGAIARGILNYLR
ncbi:MAG: hypothetical protein Fur0042_08630 [Cyanophyceae cyanobacterium]